MLLGALVGAGADLGAVRSAVDALGVEPVRLSASAVTRGGLSATKVEVTAPATDVRRTWRGIRDLLGAAALPEPVRDRAFDVFDRLARAEAAVHGVTPDEIHFH